MKWTSTPMPQAQADKLIARVAQPLPRHYNGQGCARFGVVMFFDALRLTATAVGARTGLLDPLM